MTVSRFFAHDPTGSFKNTVYLHYSKNTSLQAFLQMHSLEKKKKNHQKNDFSEKMHTIAPSGFLKKKIAKKSK
jgi:hypothetical protein